MNPTALKSSKSLNSLSVPRAAIRCCGFILAVLKPAENAVIRSHLCSFIDRRGAQPRGTDAAASLRMQKYTHHRREIKLTKACHRAEASTVWSHYSWLMMLETHLKWIVWNVDGTALDGRTRSISATMSLCNHTARCCCSDFSEQLIELPPIRFNVSQIFQTWQCFSFGWSA